MNRTRRTTRPKANRRPMRGKDLLSAARRSWNMSRIRGKHTTPEMRVRSVLHRLGYRFRLHVRIPVASVYDRRKKAGGDTPLLQKHPAKFVRPDILLVKHRLAVFVHGCFWHLHSG